MKEFSIRKANTNDLKAIQDLNNQLFELEYANFDDMLKVGWSFEEEGERYFKNAIENDIVFVAKKDDKLVGYLAGSISDTCSYVTESFAELDNMFVLSEYRKYGIGSLLFNNFKNICKEKNIDNIKVTASTKNVNAIKFYQKNGFEDYNTTLKLEIG